MTKHKSSKTELPLILLDNICTKGCEDCQGNCSPILMPENYDNFRNGKERDWNEGKKKSLAVASAARRSSKKKISQGEESAFSESRINRMENCINLLAFEVENMEYDCRKRLKKAYFCKDRMCTVCQRRRSLLLFQQNKKIFDRWMEEVRAIGAKPAFILLTLTTPNSQEDDLSAAITEMMKGFHRLFELKALDFVKGFFRTLETTYNAKSDTYNPHIHVILGVHESYFSHGYLSQKTWLELWKRSVRRSDVQIIDVRRVRAKKGSPKSEDSPESDAIKGILETSKYCVKPMDYITSSGKKGATKYQVKEQVLEVLAENLKARKLISRGRAFSRIEKEMKLEDSDDADLIKIGEEDQNEDFQPMYEVMWRWLSGSEKYQLIGHRELSKSEEGSGDLPIDPGEDPRE